MYILYFSSWGASDEQARYLRDSFQCGFKTFTVSSAAYGGFDAASIPAKFHRYIIQVTQKIVQQVVAEIAALPADEFVFLSHSFGYNLLFECLKHLQVNVKAIILLDPAGKALTLPQLRRDRDTYGGFIRVWRQQRAYAGWAAYIDRSTDGLFTRKEKKKGMYRYIKDCMKSSPLDLSIFAYGGDYFDIDATIGAYPNIHVLTSTNGVADQAYWATRATVEVVSRAGHFLHIFSQRKTVLALYRLLGEGLFVPYSTQYNAPFLD